MGADDSIPKPFDFASHAEKAAAEYRIKHSFYADLAAVVGRIMEQCLQARQIKIQTIQNRAKEPQSFVEKAMTPSDDDPNAPKYPKPLIDITDLAAVRVITYFPATIEEIDQLLHEEFEILERSDKAESLYSEEKFGYQSVHYLARIKSDRARLPEYKKYAGAVVEIQVRTILQHAWAEIEHDIQYKSSKTIPTEIKRRFMALAGLLEIADREFQAINNANQEYEAHVEKMVEQGEAAGLEITPNGLKFYLDRNLGPDGRMSPWTYDWTTRLVQQLGFRDLQQIDTAISHYDDDRLCQMAWGHRMGQIERFELMLLAAMGEKFIERHSYAHQDWFQAGQKRFLEVFRKNGIKTDTFDPDDDTTSRGDMVQGWPERIRQAQHIKTLSYKDAEFPRIKYGDEQRYGEVSVRHVCHDCGVFKGQFHVEGCDVEECPQCRTQLIGCDCHWDDNN